MSWSESILRVIVLILMSVMGIQDLHTRQVSNFITIPFFFAGLIANLPRFFSAVDVFRLVVLFQSAIILAGYYNWMGGADMKVLAGLLGLFPFAGIAAFIASGVVGAVVWAYTGRRDAKFPAVTVAAFATAATMIAVSPMLFPIFI